MPFLLDPRSLLLCLAAALLALGSGLALFERRTLSTAGLRRLALSYVVLAASLAALAQQGAGLRTPGIVIANFGFVLGIALLLEGAQLFHGRSPDRFLTVAASVLTAAGVAWFELRGSGIAARIALTNSVASLLFLRVSGIALAAGRSMRPQAGVLLALAGPVPIGLALGVRALLAGSGSRPPDLAGGDWATSATLLVALLAVVLWPMAVIGTDNRQLLDLADLAERRLAAGKRRYRDLLESAPDAMVIVDHRGVIELLNAQAERLLGYRREELIGQPIELLVPDRLRDLHARERTGFLEPRSPRGDPMSRPMGTSGGELFARRRDGSEIPVEISLSPVQTDEGVLVTAAIRDITRRRRAEEELRLSEERFRSVFERSLGYMLLLDLDGRVLSCNPSAARALGGEPAGFAGRRFLDFVAEEDRPALSRLLDAWRRGGRQEPPLEARIEDTPTPPTTWLVQGQKVEQGGRQAWLLVSAIDVSDRIRLEQTLRAKALHDGLTGLANRGLFEDRLELALAWAVRERAKGHLSPVAIAFLDLDDFKSVNDRYGHAVGDSVLVQVAARLRAGVRRGDTVARWGGDEFALVLPEIGSRAAALAVLAKLRRALETPYICGAQVLRVPASFGLALYPEDAETQRALLERADASMYADKRG